MDSESSHSPTPKNTGASTGDTPFETRTDLSELSAAVDQLREEVGRVIVGQSEMVDLILAAMLSGGHVLIEGVPGVAKTLTARLVAQVTQTDFGRIQFTPDLMPSDVLGTSIFNQQSAAFEYKKGPIFGNMILIDEVNRAPAKTQAALFEVMEEQQVSADGQLYPLPEPFMVLATQNPIEQEGTYRLPEAQLDRFLFKIKVGYPAPEEEVRILSDAHSRQGRNANVELDKVLSAEQILKFRDIASSLLVEPHLLQYIASLVQETRHNPSLYLGASPRASLALMRSAQAMAALSGRDFVTPEDIKRVAPPVLAHRILLTPEREMEGLEPEQVVEQITEKVEVPR